MNRSLISFCLTIILAGYLAISLFTIQHKNDVKNLIQSTATSEQLVGLSLMTGYSFDECVALTKHFLGQKTEAGHLAENLLIRTAFREQKIEALLQLPIQNEKKDAILWWQEKKSYKAEEERIEIDAGGAPWLQRLIGLHQETLETSQVEVINLLPFHDRDGSILLAVLFLDKYLPANGIETYIFNLSNSNDSDERVASIFLSALRAPKALRENAFDPKFIALNEIISNKNRLLAWRNLYHPNGTIDPDFALAGLLIDQKMFMKILIQTAKDELWTHPEHAIELAKKFKPTIASAIPNTLLSDVNSRRLWWHLFECGILQK